MITEKFITEEFHENGKLSYRATWGKLNPNTAHLYPNRRIHDEGYEWIYCGICGKWDLNGKQQWVINYNENGEVMKNITVTDNY
jgi:hypothetical protein